MQARPARSAFARPGTLKRGWSPATPPARRARDEYRAPATLVDAAHARLRTRVRFPPSPPLKAPLRRGFRVVGAYLKRNPIEAVELAAVPRFELGEERLGEPAEGGLVEPDLVTGLETE